MGSGKNEQVMLTFPGSQRLGKRRPGKCRRSSPAGSKDV
jgi:hypothetical protein